jgi:hypothetical protein
MVVDRGNESPGGTATCRGGVGSWSVGVYHAAIGRLMKLRAPGWILDESW